MSYQDLTERIDQALTELIELNFTHEEQEELDLELEMLELEELANDLEPADELELEMLELEEELEKLL
jgi:hypothetical protein